MKITIIGCGWLGTQVGVYLKNIGYSIKGSYRSEAGKERLVKSQIEGFLLDLDDNSQISTKITGEIDVLLISLPPLRKAEPNFYASILEEIVSQFPNSVPVIFTSSIGVYPQKEMRFDESYKFEEEERNSSLFLAEEQLKSILKDRLTILRLGGLIGPQRHPIKSLEGKTISNDGSAVINLVHSVDISRAISMIIERNTYDNCYNLVFPSKISKKIYYTFMLANYGLNAMQFGDETALNRSVDGTLIHNDYGFEYSLDPQNYTDLIVQ
ncbi:MAG: hypothetical protein HRT57_10615 [Crocinitomicaceae bacterium]|nr:hypothetical protein [Crocinitomicaceae bacterium]